MGTDTQSKKRPRATTSARKIARASRMAEPARLSPEIDTQPGSAGALQADRTFVLGLQRTYGNQAVLQYLNVAPAADTLKVAPAAADTATGPATVQRDDTVTEAPAEASKAPDKPAKKFLDQAAAKDALTKAFGTLKTIDSGKVNVLKQADFQAAYDKIYGKTKYSWDKYIKPGPGNLEGFAYDNVNYINEDCISYDTVPHEMLHNNTAADWTAVVGSEFDEGTTEHLTIAAMTKLGVTPSHSYPDQEACVKAVIAAGVSEDSLTTAYLKGGAQTLVADVITAKTATSWADFKKAMQAKDFEKAKSLLVAKPKK